MENKNEIAVIELPVELQKIQETMSLKTSIDSTDILSQFASFFYELAEIKRDFEKINFNNPSEIDSQIADTLRKKIVKIRTSSDKRKDELASDYVLVHKMITSSNTVLNTACKMDESKLNEVAKFIEIQEKKRLNLLLEQRTELLTPFGFGVDDVKGLEKMSDEVWNAFLTGAKKSYSDRIEAEQKAEADRIEKERADAEDREKQRLENERLKAEADKREAENKAKLKAEQDSKAKIEAELKAIADDIIKAETERKQAEEKAKKEAEKLAKAPIKKQLAIWVESFSISDINIENDKKALIKEKFESFKKWAKSEIESI